MKNHRRNRRGSISPDQAEISGVSKNENKNKIKWIKKSRRFARWASSGEWTQSHSSKYLLCHEFLRPFSYSSTPDDTLKTRTMHQARQADLKK